MLDSNSSVPNIDIPSDTSHSPINLETESNPGNLLSTPNRSFLSNIALSHTLQTEELSALAVLPGSILMEADTVISEVAGPPRHDLLILDSVDVPTPVGRNTETVDNHDIVDPTFAWKSQMVDWLQSRQPSAKMGTNIQELCNELKDILRSQDCMDKFYGSIIEILGSSTTAETTATKKPRKRGAKKAYKRYSYARTQDLFKKDPALLAKCIRSGVEFPDENVLPLIGKTSMTFTKLFGNNLHKLGSKTCKPKIWPLSLN